MRSRPHPVLLHLLHLCSTLKSQGGANAAAPSAPLLHLLHPPCKGEVGWVVEQADFEELRTCQFLLHPPCCSTTCSTSEGPPC